MGFNPFQEKGIPIEKQFKSWLEMNTKPYDPESVHPYTRARGILMNGIEVGAALFYCNFHRMIEDKELRCQLAMVRRIEQQQQKMVNWMIPAPETTLEVSIGYEQLAVDLTASMARNEPDPYVKAALEFALIEDLDHLYRYANLMSRIDPEKAEVIVKDLTEVIPGRPTAVQHRHPFDSARNYVDWTKADLLTLMHIVTIIAAEQQTMNYYMNVGNRIPDLAGRGLYQEIAMIEEQHVNHYGSLQDPRISWFEMAVCHEYNECYMYYSCMSSETDPNLKSMWQQMLENELTHLQIARENMIKYEKKDPVEMYPSDLPALTVLEPAKDYVRQVIADQFSFTSDQNGFVPLKDVEDSSKYMLFIKKLSGEENTPSQQAVEDTVKKAGFDYRLQTQGDYPVPILKERNAVPTPEEVINYMLL
jgi:rubrerythrin